MYLIVARVLMEPADDVGDDDGRWVCRLRECKGSGGWENECGLVYYSCVDRLVVSDEC